ncbi:male sterility protein-domain-containing protein [Phaeosphaeriaceae sp. PMI808]|nr:male sterility protein-domain-containing protein [Phaeosphaeriaceae sp. PMI808]
MQSNYFVCTLGQAAALSGKAKPYRTISEFLDLQVKHHALLPAISFLISHAEQPGWNYKTLTFGEIHHGANVFAQRLYTTLCIPGNAIALLFLLIAPQCQPAAILHLCKACEVYVLLHDYGHVGRAQKTEVLAREQGLSSFQTQLLPLQNSEDIFEAIQESTELDLDITHVDETTIAYLHHTSGTSSGLPKPIPQSHRATIGVLPHLPTIPSIATFTTTPLYHGGIADLFRCWTSNSMVWIFPGNEVPITARNICHCLNVATSYSSEEMSPKVKYFSSVPYVLQMMEANQKGLYWLKRMEIVGVGGAALPQEVGNRLVKAGQYLRNYNPSGLLIFEERDGNLAELVVKRNQGDRAFTTADFFVPHTTKENAWLYHSRADSQLTLITGKKFDPAPLEAAIATSRYLNDALVFPGALLLRSQQSGHLAITPVIEKINLESQDHARISLDMLSSKGTIIRRAAESRFEKIINSAYVPPESNTGIEVVDEDLNKYLTDLIKSVSSNSDVFTEDMDLFSYGQDLPMSVIEDYGTVGRLAEYVLRKRKGEADAKEDDEQKLMLELVKQYGSFDTEPNTSQMNIHPKSRTFGEVIVLTGATGALGAHILDLLEKSVSVDTIYYLVRDVDEHAAKKRVSKTLQQRGLASLLPSNFNSDKVKAIQAQLSRKRLGLSDELYDYLAKEVTSIIHVAWSVNFRLKLRSFVNDNIAGLHNLLNLAPKGTHSKQPRFIYCSSTASITNGVVDSSSCLPERIQPHPSSASSLGYSRSKWVAEHICTQAHNRTNLHGRITVVRVGQLTGDSRLGIWNSKEAWPMMLSTERLIGCLPDLGHELIDWLPVDIVAKAFLEITERQLAVDSGTILSEEIPVYHMLNPNQEPTWHQMLEWLKKKQEFEVVDPQEWVSRLEKSESEIGGHPAMRLLGLWKEPYGKGSEAPKQKPRFDMTQTKQMVKVLRNVQPLDEGYVERMSKWVHAHVC